MSIRICAECHYVINNQFHHDDNCPSCDSDKMLCPLEDNAWDVAYEKQKLIENKDTRIHIMEDLLREACDYFRDKGHSNTDSYSNATCAECMFLDKPEIRALPSEEEADKFSDVSLNDNEILMHRSESYKQGRAIKKESESLEKRLKESEEINIALAKEVRVMFFQVTSRPITKYRAKKEGPCKAWHDLNRYFEKYNKL